MRHDRAVPAKTWPENRPFMLRVRFRDECGRAATFARLDEAGSRARWQILWQLVSIRLSHTVALPSRDKGALPRIQEYDRINLISRFVRFRHNAMSHRRRRLPSPPGGGWGRRRRRRRPRGCGRRTRRRKRRFLFRADRLTDCKNGHKLLYGSAGSQSTGGREGGREGRKL